MTAVLSRQHAAMEEIALASGSSIAAFVASNAALPAVENAAAPEGQQDWSPIQAFIAAAAQDQSVRWMTMVDADGIVRGASDPAQIHARFAFSGEGEEWTREMRWALTGDGARLLRTDLDGEQPGETLTYTQC